MKNNYFSAKEAAHITEKAHRSSVESQTNRMFSQIAEAARSQYYKLTTREPLYPEVQQVLREYGYGVVCPDNGGACWEISWDPNSTLVKGLKH